MDDCLSVGVAKGANGIDKNSLQLEVASSRETLSSSLPKEVLDFRRDA